MVFTKTLLKWREILLPEQISLSTGEQAGPLLSALARVAGLVLAADPHLHGLRGSAQPTLCTMAAPSNTQTKGHGCAHL